jgi:hypothetical protein
MKHPPKQPKWLKAFKRKIRTRSYLNERSYEAFAKSCGISVEKLKEDWKKRN